MPVATKKGHHHRRHHRNREAEKAVHHALKILNGKDLPDSLVDALEILDDPITDSMSQVYDILNGATPVSVDAVPDTHEVIDLLEKKGSTNKAALELLDILSNPDLRALLLSHDDIGQGNYDIPIIEPPEPFMATQEIPPGMNPALLEESVRMVGLKKNTDEPLGVTVRVEYGQLVVARIIADSTIDKQGLLSIRDVIQEVNGRDVRTPKELQDAVKKSDDNIVMKVIPSYVQNRPADKTYVKALFTFLPQKDMLIPCRDAGLEFSDGDILEILDQSDQNWWQARIYGTDRTGLIPSQNLQERRRAWVRPEWDQTKSSLACGMVKRKKKKEIYSASKASDFDKYELAIYDPVCRAPPFSRRSLVLVGPQGVGQKTLIHMLMRADESEQRFGTTMPHTSKPIPESEIERRGYFFASREEMEQDIERGEYLEWGEYQDDLYGTKLDTIRAVINQGRLCILDVLPQTIKKLKTAEFAPFVVMIASPSAEILQAMHWDYGLGGGGKATAYPGELSDEDFVKTVKESMDMEKTYKQYFDVILVNDNIEQCYLLLLDAINSLRTESQWVPASWVY